MFGFHPANLVVRFLLEIAALIAAGIGVYTLGSGSISWVLGIGLPVVLAVCWGVFNVPGDRSRSGEAPVAVSGVVRLLLELLIFAIAVVLVSLVSATAAVALAVATGVHYLLSFDRIRWLLAN